MKKGLSLVLLLVVVLSLFGCGGASTPKVALMLARGGLGDKAFNDGAYAGLQKAEKELGAEVEAFEFQDGDAQVEAVRQAAEDGYQLIIGLGSENSGPISTVAAEFPNVHFATVDTAVDGANITSITFSELEGDFLAGALAALLSTGHKVGYLGGADVLVIRRIQFGFEQGAKYVDPGIEIVSQYIGGRDDFSGFANPDKGQEITAQMYAEGVDVVYAAAGGSGLGAIEAAKSAGKLIITTGSDQRWIAPEVVVTSRTKNMDTAVFDLVQQFADGKLVAGTVQLNYASGGIGLAPVTESLVPSDALAKFNQIRADLEAGKINIEPFTGQ